MQTAIIALLAAIVGGIITAFLAHGRFKKEWWWQQKAAAYSKLIFAIHESSQFSQTHLHVFETGSKVSDKRDAELREKFNLSSQLIDQARDTGIFFLSEKAVARLKVLESDQSKARNSVSWFDHLESDNIATSSCLKDIIEIAKLELAIPWYMRIF